MRLFHVPALTRSPHTRVELTLGNTILHDAKRLEGRKKTIIIFGLTLDVSLNTKFLLTEKPKSGVCWTWLVLARENHWLHFQEFSKSLDSTLLA